MTRTVLALAALLLAGCQLNPWAGAGSTTLTLSPSAAQRRDARFDTAYYSFDQRNHLTIVLLEGDPEQPTAAATVRMFWRPKTGSTPVDPSATNTTIRYILFEQDGRPTAAVYSGAGFLRPHTSRGEETFHGELVESNLRLVDAPEGFNESLGLVNLAGVITARRDDVQTHRTLRRLQQQLSERLGYPRLVMR